MGRFVARHGHTGSPTYSTWLNMLGRCLNRRLPGFDRYGGRGISVCDRWRVFENFLADMGPRPSKDHSLDRIDNDGNYEPGNCRWATRVEQANNTRANIRITHNGETLTAAQWSVRLGARPEVVAHRILNGWDEIRAITTPVVACDQRTHCVNGHAYAEHGRRREDDGTRRCMVCRTLANRKRSPAFLATLDGAAGVGPTQQRGIPRTDDDGQRRGNIHVGAAGGEASADEKGGGA